MSFKSYTEPGGGESEPMLHSPVGRPKATKTAITLQRLGRGILITRYLLLAFLAAVTVLGWYFQSQMMTMQTALKSEHEKVEALQVQMNVHEQVIQRFNSSITNTDVMNRLGSLETQFMQTQKELHQELQTTQDEITTQLQNTLHQLSTTVDQAEQEISEEVEKVKKDVEQYVVTTQDQFSMENSFMVYQLAGTFTLLSCLISMWHMTAHMRKMNEPDVQRRILAILWMSPVYAVTSWFSLVFHEAEGYLAIVKDGYEAYIIYQFLSFCIAVLGKGDRSKVVDLLAHHADHLTPPFRLFGCCEYVFAMQFVLFRPLTTTAMVVLGKLHYYGAGDGPTDYKSPQFYITIVQNLSIFIAFTGLLKVDKELAWCRPFAKFLCIKGVVFMTFWQGLAISILAQTTDVGGQDEEEWAKSAQNFLICLEMLLFSIAHFYCFPTEEWQEGYRVKHEQGQFGDTIALGDFFADVKLILQSKPTKKKKRHRSDKNSPKSSRKLAAVPEGKHDEDHDESVEVVHSEESNDKGRIEAIEEGEYIRSSSSGTGTSESVEDEGRAANPRHYENEYSYSFSDTSQARGEGSDSDEERGRLGRHFEGLSEDDRKITRALEKSLGMAADDPDIAEAARRLLDSKILSPEFFQGVLSDDDDDENYRLYSAGTRSEDDDESWTDDGEDDNNNDGETSRSSIGLSLPLDTNSTHDEEDVQLVEEKSPTTGQSPPGPNGSNPETIIEGDNEKQAATLIPALQTTTEATPKVRVKSPKQADVALTEAPSLASTIGGESKKAEPVVTKAEFTGIPMVAEDDVSRGRQSRAESDGSFWTFDNNATTPTRETSEPLPLPPTNEGTPLLNRQERSASVGPSTPLNPSIFTTVAALAEESDQEDQRRSSLH
eukprot:scaffold4063_cov178-Amphora_coffeaeformis.AAC.4